ncbi:MAG: hypothetical protein KDD69_13400 [Bdellovibrionales bacterium]|nr:hypothetical protein [Bdellovibrionales bacterium]
MLAEPLWAPGLVDDLQRMRRPPTQINSFLQNALTVDNAVFVLGNLCIIAAVGFAAEMGENLPPGSGFRLPEVELPKAEESIATLKRSDLASYSIIAARNIFGAAPPEQATEEKPAPVTELKLRLVGTNVSSTGQPFAIIEDTTKKEQELFDLNQSVFNQAKLVAVEPESVKLDRNGKIEILVLEENFGGTSATGGDEGVETLNEDQTEFSVAEAELEDALANLPRLLSQARAVPYFRNGKSVGMRLFAIRRDSLYEKLGMKNGDIVKAVNDNSLTDPAQALKLFEQLKNERSIKVRVERGGQDIDLSYSIG